MSHQLESKVARPLPQNGEHWTANGFRVQVLHSDENRVEYVKPRRSAPARANTDWFLDHFEPVSVQP